MKRNTRVKPDLYQVVTHRLLQLIEAGTPPWVRAYNRRGPARNYATGHVYTGINAFVLNYFADHPHPFYLTYKQAQDLGGQVRKGAKSEPVFFFKTIYKDADGRGVPAAQVATRRAAGQDLTAIPMPRKFAVFNVADVDGIDFDLPPLLPVTGEPLAAGEQLLASLHDVPPILHTDPNGAYYRPQLDAINVPPVENFLTGHHYYSTLFHEIIHATGAGHRLNRPGITQPIDKRRPGSALHAQEELIAEIGAAFLAQQAGLNSPAFHENTASYLAGHLKLLRNDKRAIFRAAAAAQKAIDYLTAQPRTPPPE